VGKIHQQFGQYLTKAGGEAHGICQKRYGNDNFGIGIALCRMARNYEWTIQEGPK
jgi:hypothetical protein